MICLEGHSARAPASVVPWDGDFSCDNCGQEMPEGACMWRCDECDMELCYSCCRTPSQALHASPSSEIRPCPQGHAMACMATTPQFHSGPASCNNCQQGLGGPNSAPYFFCAECQYYRCRECAAIPADVCRDQSVDDGSQIQVRLWSSHTSTAAEDRPLERAPRHSELLLLQGQHQALRVALHRQQAQLEEQSAALQMMRQQQELTEPFAPRSRHQMRSGRQSTSEASMGRHHTCEGSRSAIGEAERRAIHHASCGAITTVDQTSAELARRWEELQRAPRSAKLEKLRQIEQLKARPDFVAAQRKLRKAPDL